MQRRLKGAVVDVLLHTRFGSVIMRLAGKMEDSRDLFMAADLRLATSGDWQMTPCCFGARCPSKCGIEGVALPPSSLENNF